MNFILVLLRTRIFCVTVSQAEMRSIFANVRRKGTTNLFVGTYSEDMMEMVTFPFDERRRNERNCEAISRV